MFHRDQWWVVAACLLLMLSSYMTFAAAPSSASSAMPQSNTTANDYALIYGTVWGPDERPLGGVPVTIRRATDKKPKWELVSDSRGEFAQRVPPGKMDYFIQANIKTPKGQPKPEVTVEIDNNERKDVGLHLPAPASAKK